MSNLEELIERLCPDGVEYKKIGEIGTLTRGKRFVHADAVEDNGIPCIHYGELYTYYGVTTYDIKSQVKKELANKLRYASKNDVVIVGAGENAEDIGIAVAYLGESEIAVHDACYIWKHHENPKYLSYCLRTRNYHEQLKKYVSSGKICSVSATGISKIQLPVPPLEVQREIVRILDNFTFLTTELAAELAARQKQYEYYRDLLLTFKPNESTILNERTNELELSGTIRWMKLGDIGSICMCKRILKSETNQNGGIPFYKIGTFGKQADAYISNEKFIEYKNRYKFPKKGDILISAAGTIGRTVVYDGKPAYFQDSNIVWIDNDETRVLNTFLNYWYSTSPWVASTGGTISRLYNDNIAKAPIPVPPLEVQQRIVDILDRFDTLCNDISSGLPAEIEARQKQYEYYRDKLLTFKELKKEA